MTSSRAPCIRAPGADKILEIENATVFRGTTRVFDGLSLHIERHQNTAILGPNGAGKTTLLRLVTRDLYPVVRPGSYVRVLGKQRWNVFELRSQLGVVSPELQTSFQRRIGATEVVLSGFFSSIGLHPHQRVGKEQLHRARRAIETLRVGHLGERLFSTLSIGEQRRFLLARALVHEPHTLILDEPTAGLDMRGAFELLQSLRRLAQGGTTLILVTHHLREILPEVEWVVLLKHGRVWAHGEKREILTAANLSQVFEVSLELVERDGYYQASAGNAG